MNHEYDAIIVGARCGGAPTAMLLARYGHRVLLVDRATFPSDTLSTLMIHSPGVAALQRWGLLAEVIGTGCPAIDTYSYDFGPVVIAGAPRGVDGITKAYAPRRTVLDKILVDAAARSGVEVRQSYLVEEIVIEDGVAVGVRGHSGDEPTTLDRARVVVGADGWNSTVAKAVGAEQYHQKPVLENAFYTFWSGLPVDRFTTLIRGDRGIAAIPTNDDLTLVLVGCPFAQASEFRRDIEGNYFAALDRAPELAERIRSATREERFVGGGVPNFFRVPSGPGWVLVGDAGYTKDPVTAQGISDALKSAERCAAALNETFTDGRPFSDAMRDYQQRRDAEALPIYEFTTQLATLEPPPAEMQQFLGAIAGNQPAMDAFVSVTAGTLSPADLFDAAGVGTPAS